jgi:hypothetical protein
LVGSVIVFLLRAIIGTTEMLTIALATTREIFPVAYPGRGGFTALLVSLGNIDV